MRLAMFSKQSLLVLLAFAVVGAFGATSGDYSWYTVKKDDPIPSNTVPGGIILFNNSEPGIEVYVARRKFDNVYRIGKFYNPKKTGNWDAYFLMDGDEKIVTGEPLELLVSTLPGALRWVPTSSGVIPRRAVYFAPGDGETRYVCRGIMSGNTEKALVVVPGEATGVQGWCQTFWYTRGIHVEYQVLVRLEDDNTC